MGVPCSGCGRTYDVALFPFGRTIHCSCGRRVGIEPRVRRADPAVPPRFAADAMLGRLARWLRLLGFDTTFVADVDDAELVRSAIESGREILTRDRRLAREWWVSGIHCLAGESTFEQLRELFGRFDLAGSVRPFTRCSRCNALLTPVARERVRERLPARVYASGVRLQRCPVCERLYWQGSHTRRVGRVVERLVAGDTSRAR